MYTSLSVGLLPTSFEFYQDGDKRFAAPTDMEDSIAQIVLDRFRNARQDKANLRFYQGKSVITNLREADYALEKRYTSDTEQALMDAFGFCPTRYYGLSAAKTREVAAWKGEIVSGSPGDLVRIIPTPNPRLPEATVKRIKEEVKQDLVRRMMDMGFGDPSILFSVANGRLHESVKKFLDDKAAAVKAVEQAKMVSQAMDGAKKVENLIRDVVVEGDFREAYTGFSFNQCKYGVGIMRFPYWQRRVVLSSAQDMKGKPERKWQTVPTFQDVSPWNFFPTNDARDVSTNTANMEYRELSKATLISLGQDNRYDRKAIEWILNEYSMRSRTWLFPEASQTESESGESSTYWSPEESVAVIYHEGFVTGHDLQEFGLTGYEASEQFNVIAEVCCGRTIRLEVKSPTEVLPRSYAVAKYEDLGHGIWNAIGIPGILQNTQDRINVLLHCFENNVDWALRPPMMMNPDALKNPSEIMNVRPGAKAEISDLLGPGVSPDPIRVVRGPTSQFQILYPLIQSIIRQADSEVGVPTLASMTDYGRGSLGEFSARISGAVRRVRNAAYAEDRSMGKIWHVLFEYVLEENPELVAEIDLDMNYVGVVGLLAQESERRAKMERLQLVMNGMQSGMVPKEVGDFVFQDILSDMGVPTDALGMTNPVIDNAVAIAMQGGLVQPGGGAGAGNLGGAPQLDGRSGAMASVPTAVAAPNGGPAPMPPPV